MTNKSNDLPAQAAKRGPIFGEERIQRLVRAAEECGLANGGQSPQSIILKEIKEAPSLLHHPDILEISENVLAGHVPDAKRLIGLLAKAEPSTVTRHSQTTTSTTSSYGEGSSIARDVAILSSAVVRASWHEVSLARRSVGFLARQLHTVRESLQFTADVELLHHNSETIRDLAWKLEEMIRRQRQQDPAPLLPFPSLRLQDPDGPEALPAIPFELPGFDGGILGLCGISLDGVWDLGREVVHLPVTISASVTPSHACVG